MDRSGAAGAGGTGSPTAATAPLLSCTVSRRASRARARALALQGGLEGY
jgi:hypothetical protein